MSFSQVTFVTRNGRVRTTSVNKCFGEKRNVIYTQHYQLHCFWQRSTHLGVASAICYFYNTNKVNLYVHRLRTRHKFSASRWLGLCLLSMFCLMRFDFQLEALFRHTHTHTYTYIDMHIRIHANKYIQKI